VRETFTVRKVSQGIGVELTVPPPVNAGVYTLTDTPGFVAGMTFVSNGTSVVPSRSWCCSAAASSR
ncbi:hypothetical protein, partial [Aestuariivirga sp.]|uniref:hypothetical protein n=1 Tax=Aestuariivirga sp. TaxID=2650926 RepID=UPI0030177320